ncbi:Hypothetical predicted protein [Mytilus galloprovincialis]|uniref:Death domain-containing protein n=1 Tax=Mytilus galloprovincialis TaxID=29158 RepID=A0A8B6G412_MYTGA|nr:Hypothetical predicted protein [Mytilus galloprovincialis]
MDNDFLDDKWKQWKQTLENDLKTHKSPYLKDEMYRFKHSSRNDLNKNIGNKETTIAFIQKMSFNDNEIEELEMSATISVEKTTTTEEIRKDKKINPHHVVSKEHTPESPVPSKTLNVLQEEELRKSIFDEIRRGEYNVEIAPSDLVDFGGQKAFDMTHQLFIMQEGTVLLLFDGSKDLDEPLPEYPGKNITSADILMHWVNSVTTYCTDDSGLQRIQFVATHSDRYKGNFEKRRKELVMQLTTRFKKHEIGSHLLFDNLIFIDARNKDDKEIDRLKDQLVQLAFSQSSWGKKMPLIWVPLEKQIVDLKLRGTSILRMEEIEKLNRLNEDLMMDDEKLKFFLRTQHAIGKLIFFDQDELADFVIIEPSVLVNALRSFVTDEMFFPSENYHILKILQQDGMLKTTDLMKLWNQDEFQYIFQNQEYKDFLVKILLHLDVLVKPKIDYRDVNFLPEYYIVPCMIQTRLDNDYIEKYLNTNKSICMAYVLKVQMVPPCILFRLIASAVGIWPLKVYQGRKMIFQDIATFVFDETNEFSIIMQGGKIVVYFTNSNSIKEIQSPKVASVQECLTIAIISITEFYQLHSRSIDDLDNTRFDNLFELKHGAACKIPCFVNREEELQFPKAGLWKCQHGQIHEVDYLWYWDSKKAMADISPTVLTKKPPADLLRKVSFAVGIDGAKLGLNLGIESSVIEKMVIGNRYNIFEKTQKILDYWEMLCYSVTVKHLVDALNNVGGRGLETIVEYYR